MLARERVAIFRQDDGCFLILRLKPIEYHCAFFQSRIPEFTPMTPTISTNSKTDTATMRARPQLHHGSILDDVCRRLGKSGYHQHRRITFDFHEGVLTLRGIVSSFFLKQLAHVLVADVDGIDEVANRLEVRYPAASYET